MNNKRLPKSGGCKTGVDTRAFLRVLKALDYSLVQYHVMSDFNNAVRGAAI